MKFFLIILSLLVGVLGCATAPQLLNPLVDCRGMDWFELGRLDAVAGKNQDSFFESFGKCKKSHQNVTYTQYQNGYNRGQAEYCSTENGFAIGREGLDYAAICPEAFWADFLLGYHRGLAAHLIDKKNRELDKRLSDFDSRLGTQALSQAERRILKNQKSKIARQKAANDEQLQKLSADL